VKQGFAGVEINPASISWMQCVWFSRWDGVESLCIHDHCGKHSITTNCLVLIAYRLYMNTIDTA